MMRRTTNKVDLDHLAQLAKLKISPQEKNKLARQLLETIDYVEILDELKTKTITATYQINQLVNVSRKDQIGDSLKQKGALRNAKRQQKGYFATERVRWE